MGNNFKFFGVLAFAALLSSCATPEPQAQMDDGPQVQVISVNTPGVTGANCFVQAKGMSYPVSAPGKVAVRKTGAPMDVTCFKGEHLIGNARMNPVCSAAPCGYASSVTVAMTLDAHSMERDVRFVQ